MMGEMKDEFGSYDGECAGCEGYCRINDIGLCEGCSAKLERDLIRQRDWTYSMTAHGLSDKQRETVRRQIVRKYAAGHGADRAGARDAVKGAGSGTPSSILRGWSL